MTEKQLYGIKNTIAWCGPIVTAAGIILNFIEGAHWRGPSIALIGVVVTCYGNWLSAKLDRKHANKQAESENRIMQLESEVDHLNRYPPRPKLS